MSPEEFVYELSELGIKLTKLQIDQLNKYYEMLVEYNKHMNLTGITSKPRCIFETFL